MASSSLAQNSLVKKWDKSFGGGNDEWLSNLQVTNDGGFILGGFTNSTISGDVTQNGQGYGDYWVLKTDSLGNKMWDKRFGGNADDWIFSLQQTTDRGFILGGVTNSDSSGDVSYPSHGTDFWLIKTDSLGNKKWDKRFWGNVIDELLSLQQTTDGGYILGGFTTSDSSGDISEHTRGEWDYWILKIDSLGNKIWDKRFGGNKKEQLFSLQQTLDGGYILGGWTNSDSSGEVSQLPRGGRDYWILKTDSLGNKQWDKRYGGLGDDYFYSLQQTSDGGFILGGWTNSDKSGDISSYTYGLSDYWIVKTDPLGNKMWDKRFGGNLAENKFGNISETTDKGFLIAGTSYSSISGSKTENNLGPEQSWIIKIDGLGIKQWDKTLFTVTQGLQGFAAEVDSDCYVFANYTASGIGGHKTQSSQGGLDYWLVKFCDSIFFSTSIQQNDFHPSVSVFPNPFLSDISITILKQNIKQASFIIRNSLGQAILSKQENNISNNYTKMLDLSFLEKGIYILDVVVDGETSIVKLVKQ
jgi:hypothetical protein